jgi:hypothetical protein
MLNSDTSRTPHSTVVPGRLEQREGLRFRDGIEGIALNGLDAP